MNVRKAGIDEGISEVIVTSRSAAGTFNAAPIGIRTTTNGHFVKLYKGSRTFSNVQGMNKLAANVTPDAVLFVKAAFEQLNEEYISLFSGFPVLKEAQSWILFLAVLEEKSSEYSRFQLSPIAVKINQNDLKAINRGLNAVIEATILATRYKITPDEREREELKKQMALYANIVEKCGGRREKDAIEILNAKFFT